MEFLVLVYLTKKAFTLVFTEQAEKVGISPKNLGIYKKSVPLNKMTSTKNLSQRNIILFRVKHQLHNYISFY